MGVTQRGNERTHQAIDVQFLSEIPEQPQQNKKRYDQLKSAAIFEEKNWGCERVTSRLSVRVNLFISRPYVKNDTIHLERKLKRL